ncbi:MAG TPA: hypothetical protein P5268_08240 [Candidatus Marinimicrobia bacterium]|nr:hypothetical protein [Candidatus Neomarinimicrobiota bacterium]
MNSRFDELSVTKSVTLSLMKSDSLNSSNGDFSQLPATKRILNTDALMNKKAVNNDRYFILYQIKITGQCLALFSSYV